MNIYFKNIRLIDPATNRDEKVNLWIKEGIVQHCLKSETQLDSTTETIDAENLVAAPGFIDMNADLGDPGFEYREGLRTGSAAAAQGGFTDVVVSPDTDPVIDNATVIEFIKNKAKDLSVDIHTSGTITQGLRGDHITQMLEMHDHGALYFTDSVKSVPNTEVLRRAFDYASSKDLLLVEHAEDKYMSNNSAMNESKLSFQLGLKGFPHISEETIVARDILMSDYCGNGRLHFRRITTKYSTELIKNAKNKNLRVSAETSPHYFYFTEEEIHSFKTYYKVNPPFRQKDDINSLIKALKENIIEVITSDHRPAALHEKDVEYELAPYGINGIETTVALSIDVLHHKNAMDLTDLIAKFTTNPRRILNLDQVSFEKGANAKITILDVENEWIYNKASSKSKASNNPYENMKFKGKPLMIINGNKLVKSGL